ncbi:MAG TPA: GspH/FimT family pseudopilin [Verrucomicrobiae bacterium]
MTCHRAQTRLRASHAAPRRVRSLSQTRAFTLIELILVMSILTIAVSVTAPALANFFRGRTLDSEARRLLALTRQGQSRAVSEGIPMELWVDSQRRTFGLEAEPSYEPIDEKAVEFTWESDIQLEAVNDGVNRSPGGGRLFATSSGAVAGRAVLSRHPELPRIRFLPDGSIAESSPQKLCLTGSDGFSIWLTQSRNRSSYELSNRSN